MPIAEGTVRTDRAMRYLVQLCRHSGQMRRMRHQPSSPQVSHVDHSDTVGEVRFANGVLKMQAGADTLTLRVEAVDEDGLQRLQDGVASRLRTIGRRDGLVVTWHRVDPGEAAHATHVLPGRAAGKPWQRRRFGMVAVLGVAALIVVVHLALGGAAVAATAWRSWAGSILLVIVVGAVVFIGAHVILGRYAYRGVRKRHDGERT